MAIHAPMRPAPEVVTPADPPRAERLERDLAEASVLLERLLAAEDRIGLVWGVMDDARGFLARRRRGG